MKKLITAAIGIALFVTGYKYNRRLAEHVTAQTGLSQPTYTISTTPISAEMKHTPAFRLIKSS